MQHSHCFAARKVMTVKPQPHTASPRPRVTALAQPTAWALLMLHALMGGVLAAVSPPEVGALVDMYKSLNGPAWIVNDRWPVGDPCANGWAGLGCNAAGTHITQM